MDANPGIVRFKKYVRNGMAVSGTFEMRTWHDMGMEIAATAPEGYVHLLTIVLPQRVYNCSLPKFTAYLRESADPQDSVKINGIEFWRKDRLDTMRDQYLAQFKKG
jgi:hypothetical protein